MLKQIVTPFTDEQVEDIAIAVIRQASPWERGLLVAYGGELVAEVSIDARTETDFQRIFVNCAPAAYRAALGGMTQAQAVEFQQAVARRIFDLRQAAHIRRAQVFGGAR